ncbi:MAG TPA: hypothetical protein DD618_01325 [Acholeplasmatales bacterium]|nr:hypothetical protein [Acholeplasmatales bacterium]
MKTFLILLTLITTSFVSDFTDQFDSEVNSAYSAYVTHDEYENPNYSLKVIYGALDGKVRFGICFYSLQAGDYSVKVSYLGRQYSLPENGRGDVRAVATDFLAGETFSVLVFDREGHYQYSGRFLDIEVLTINDFNALSSPVAGLGAGSELTQLQSFHTSDPLTIFYFFLLGVAALCVVAIIIIYVRKKGMFDPKIKSEPGFNFREFINQEPLEPAIQPSQETSEMLPESAPTIQPQEPTVIPASSIRNYSWVRDEEEHSGFNVAAYLKDLGFITDYALDGEDEKNRIMLELMKLRDQKKITHDDYLEETTKLWKK